MSRHHVALVTISAFVLLATFVAVGFGWFSSKPIMTIYLRCERNISGKLSVATFPENDQLGSKESFDLETVCKARQIEFCGYQYDENLQFTFERFDGETVEMIAEYGRNIQFDQHGLYTVLKLMNTPPFIANDSI